MQTLAHSTQTFAVVRAMQLARLEKRTTARTCTVYRKQCSEGCRLRESHIRASSMARKCYLQQAIRNLGLSASSSGGGLFGRLRLARVETLFEFLGDSAAISSIRLRRTR
jgi:hypothetical protein